MGGGWRLLKNRGCQIVLRKVSFFWPCLLLLLYDISYCSRLYFAMVLLVCTHRMKICIAPLTPICDLMLNCLLSTKPSTPLFLKTWVSRIAKQHPQRPSMPLYMPFALSLFHFHFPKNSFFRASLLPPPVDDAFRFHRPLSGPPLPNGCSTGTAAAAAAAAVAASLIVCLERQ